jgi:hypothetical protein
VYTVARLFFKKLSPAVTHCLPPVSYLRK